MAPYSKILCSESNLPLLEQLTVLLEYLNLFAQKTSAPLPPCMGSSTPLIV